MVVETGRAEKLPPHDIEAEEAVIASLLVDPEAMYKVAPKLHSEDFFREKNAWVYEACRALWDRSESINQITVSHELARQNRLDDVGGVTYLSRLVTELPTSVGVEHYAGIVVRDAIYRNVISAVRRDRPHGLRGSGATSPASVRAPRPSWPPRSKARPFATSSTSGSCSPATWNRRQRGVGAVAGDVRAITTGFMDLDTILTRPQARRPRHRRRPPQPR